MKGNIMSVSSDYITACELAERVLHVSNCRATRRDSDARRPPLLAPWLCSTVTGGDYGN